MQQHPAARVREEVGVVLVLGRRVGHHRHPPVVLEDMQRHVLAGRHDAVHVEVVLLRPADVDLRLSTLCTSCVSRAVARSSGTRNDPTCQAASRSVILGRTMIRG